MGGFCKWCGNNISMFNETGCRDSPSGSHEFEEPELRWVSIEKERIEPAGHTKIEAFKTDVARVLDSLIYDVQDQLFEYMDEFKRRVQEWADHYEVTFVFIPKSPEPDCISFSASTEGLPGVAWAPAGDGYWVYRLNLPKVERREITSEEIRKMPSYPIIKSLMEKGAKSNV